jgi:hypothetical protein
MMKLSAGAAGLLALSTCLAPSSPVLSQQPRCFFLEGTPGDATAPVPQTTVPQAPAFSVSPSPKPSQSAHAPRPRSGTEVCEHTAGFTYCGSSVLAPQYGFNYRPSNMTDNRLDTAWVEGQAGDGIGEWVVVEFGRERRFAGFEILNGYHKNVNLFKANNRVRELEMVLSSGYRQTISLQDASGPQRINAQSGGISATWVQLMIKSVYPGTKYKDTAITELRILTAD